MNEKVNEFKRNSDKSLRIFQSNNPTIPKYIHPSSIDSCVVERIMRVGVEARALEASCIDELESIAMATLQNDFIKYAQGKE
jgi:hypothetical protein